MKSNNEFLTVEEACRILGITRRHLHNLTWPNGEIRKYKRMGRVYYLRADVEKFNEYSLVRK